MKNGGMTISASAPAASAARLYCRARSVPEAPVLTITGTRPSTSLTTARAIRSRSSSLSLKISEPRATPSPWTPAAILKSMRLWRLSSSILPFSSNGVTRMGTTPLMVLSLIGRSAGEIEHLLDRFHDRRGVGIGFHVLGHARPPLPDDRVGGGLAIHRRLVAFEI